jgi:hypothetical protein
MRLISIRPEWRETAGSSSTPPVYPGLADDKSTAPAGFLGKKVDPPNHAWRVRVVYGELNTVSQKRKSPWERTNPLGSHKNP